jgi:hypothetical protein
MSFAKTQLATNNVGDSSDQENDEFYTTDIVYVGSPQKWFNKTSGTRVYIKDSANAARREIEQKLKVMVANTEDRRDKFIRREILRKNIWKYRPQDFNDKSKSRMGGKKENQINIVAAFNR